MDDELNIKKKKLNIWLKLVIGAAALLVIFALLRIFGVLQWYNMDGRSNMPNLKHGDQFLASNLITPERFDFITFKTDYFGWEEVWVSRFCAFEGEAVSFKDGTFFMNGQILDSHLDLQYRYRCEASFGHVLAEKLGLEFYLDYYPMVRPEYNLDSVDLFLTSEQVIDRPLLKRRILSEPNDTIAAYWVEPLWNENYFGPITFPKDHCFVLGDNRDNSSDSRYIGFIHLDDVYGMLF